MKEMDLTIGSTRSIRDLIIDRSLSTVEGCHLNGHRTKRICNNANFRFDRIDGEALILDLDLNGIAASTGSACSSRSSESSHVLKALGVGDRDCKGSLRISLARTSTKAEAEFYLEALTDVIGRLRGLAPSETFSVEGSKEVRTCPTTER
jgi:cysteine desulfurase